MAGLGALPGLSELLSWGTDHLTESADYWESFADRLESGFAEAHNLIRTSGWEGQAYDKSESRAAADEYKASGVAHRYRTAAKIAREGASNESAAQSALRYAVEDAWDAGFNVYDDGTVQDAGSAATAAEQAARHAQAEVLAGNIRQRALQLLNLDQQIGSSITTALGDLTGFSFDEAPVPTSPDDTIGDGNNKRHVSLVDHAWKTGPDQPPAPPPGPSAADIRQVLDKLPVGNSPEVREVRSQQDLDNLWNWMKQNGVDNPNRYGDPGKGEWKDLPNGAGVGRRQAAGSTNQPALDVRLPGKDGYVKVHINPERGGVPEIPPPARAAPAEPPPARAPGEPPPAGRPQPALPAAAPPAERAPVERAPVEPPAPPPPAPRTGGFGGGSIGGGGGGPLPGQHGSIWEPTE
ncbi:hypothetical protein BMW24_018310 [Mycobacterium heckeshornense]|uniref:Uncharacterized protein n=1 Tax=Mycobacterium heckeshornense TaxID=110505 RepID=A0A2G8B3M1_9MYCO|nr:hypothetical protein [Mycobacterium heckeshornense]MCV7034251.1 hypothetical protein [Mycobacterium heckeshornense]PIJ32348.1 hypothetical protein BMW24_018310 [Mycobacterium heckeshornense]BCO38324.1 hypothetical protein MHEC_47570 [Mycobacterium heckeshornense]